MNELQTYIYNYFNIEIDDLQEVEKLFQVTHLSKDEFVCQENSRCETLNFIISGFVGMAKNGLSNIPRPRVWVPMKSAYIRSKH